MNKRQTSKKVASKAGKLPNKSTNKNVKSVAGSTLSQTKKGKK